MQGLFSVQIRDFAQRHFIKGFQKKYKNHWDRTLISIIQELERIDSFILTDRAETITDHNGIKLVKTKFRVDGTKESAKTSGNRCIVVWNCNTSEIEILLVYSKTDLSGHDETADWKRLVRDNYPEYEYLV